MSDEIAEEIDWSREAISGGLEKKQQILVTYDVGSGYDESTGGNI